MRGICRLSLLEEGVAYVELMKGSYGRGYDCDDIQWGGQHEQTVFAQGL